MDEIADLYDLFGESAFCNICQDDIKEGERVYCLNKCKHVFHNDCIEKWFKEKTICPVCRTTYNVIFRNDNDIIINDIDRLFMTWTLIHGVLKKHKNAESFNNKKNEIKTLFSSTRLNNVKSLYVDLDSRSALSSMKSYIATRISKLLYIDKNKIYRQPQVYNWIDRIESIVNINSLWSV